MAQEIVEGKTLEDIEAEALRGKQVWQEVINKVNARKNAVTDEDIANAYNAAKEYDQAAQGQEFQP